MSQKQARKDAKRAKKKKAQAAKAQQKMAQAAIEQLLSQDTAGLFQKSSDDESFEQLYFPDFEDDGRGNGTFSDRLAYCSYELSFSVFAGHKELTELTPCRLSFISLSELFRISDSEFRGLLPARQQSHENESFERFLQTSDKADSIAAVKPFDTPLQRVISELILPVAAKLNQDGENSGDWVINKPAPDANMLKSFNDMRSFCTEHDAELMKYLIGYANDVLTSNQPLTADVLTLGRRIVQTYLQQAPLTFMMRIELCTRLSEQYQQELKNGQHQYTEEQQKAHQAEWRALCAELMARGEFY